jgi:cell division protease FtsH
MVTRYGMDEGLGYVAIEVPRSPMLELPDAFMPARLRVSEHTQRRVDEAVQGIVMNAFEQAQAVLRKHRALLERGAGVLLEKETLDEADLRELTLELRDGEVRA